MHSLHDFVVVADAALDLEEWEIASGGESYRLSDVFSALPWRPGVQVLFSSWTRREYTLRHRGGPSAGQRFRFGWREPLKSTIGTAAHEVVVRSSDDIGFKYQLNLSLLAQALGLQELGRRVTMTTRRQSPEADLHVPDEPYALRLSADTLYFHDALDAFLVFLDCLVTGRWNPLRARNIIVHPAMTTPETKALGSLVSLDWLCAEKGLSLYVLSLDRASFKYLRHARFIDSCENYLHRVRTGDYPQPQGPPRFKTFMAWDAGWSPDEKGLPLVLELFRQHRIRRPLVVKIPDRRDDAADPGSLRDLVERYRGDVDVRLVDVPGGREGFLETVWRDVDIFIHAGNADVGPRTVLEAAGMNKRILFYEGDDCDLLRYGMFKGLEGFRTFDEFNLGERLAALETEEPRTVGFFERHDWRRTRDLLREETGDSSLRGFWLEGALRLEPA